MTALPLIITTAGLARFTAAQVDEDIDLGITSVGLTNQVFVAAPTLTALPGQFRAVNTISGEAVGDNIVHMIVRDAAELSYTVRGFGLYLEDGTLFAVYGQEQPLFEKAAASTMLLAVDMAFPTGNVDLIEFGDTNFLNPPATTERAGVVELATAAEATAGADAQRAVTPAALRAALGALIGIGHISMWYGSAETVPAGWAICDGQTVSRSDGAGNITTPDLRDRVVIGAGGVHAQGAEIGAFSKTVDSAAAGVHTHTGTAAPHGHGFIASASDTVPGDSMTINATYKIETAGGGTDKTIKTVAIMIDGDTEDSAPADLTVADAGGHEHEVTIDVTQPSLALHFIMRI
jgi:microcystin-dependent protein